MVRHGVRLFLLLTALVLPLAAQAQATVTRLQGDAQAVETAGSRALAIGDPVHRGDRLRTGAGSRLQLRFSDGMELTLGDGAEMVVSAFDWTPAMAAGSAELSLVQGAFLLESGAVGKLPGHPLVVKTPLASVGVRGTRFWGGPLDAPLNVLLLEGRVVVTSPGGSVELGPGQGTGIAAAGAAPMPPSVWSDERVDRAVATVSFDR
ncbi:MAG: FecR family protein [Phaeospirillum sp.]|nr:FecR family protein [Phaeospirillum sp.]